MDWRKANVRDGKISRDTANTELSWKQFCRMAVNTQKKHIFKSTVNQERTHCCWLVGRSPFADVKHLQVILGIQDRLLGCLTQRWRDLDWRHEGDRTGTGAGRRYSLEPGSQIQTKVRHYIPFFPTI